MSIGITVGKGNGRVSQSFPSSTDSFFVAEGYIDAEGNGAIVARKFPIKQSEDKAEQGAAVNP